MKSCAVVIAILAVLVLGAGCSDDETPAGVTKRRAIHVPGDFATIQAAMDTASSGDTILVADGVYSGPGFRNIELGDTYVIIRSEHGPASTTIDGGDTTSGGGRAFYGTNTLLGIRIEGFTIRDFWATQGAAIDLVGSRIFVENCIFLNNHAAVGGGAIHCKSSKPEFSNCTFVNNVAGYGGAVQLMAVSPAIFDQCVFAGNSPGAIGANSGSDTPVLSCSDVFSNPGGDWSGHLAGQETVRGNMSADPGFCGPDDYHLKSSSPLVAGNNSCGKQIGALGVGCQ